MTKLITLKKKNLLQLKIRFKLAESNNKKKIKKVVLLQFKHNKIFLVNNIKLFAVPRQKSKKSQKQVYITSYYYKKKLFDYINLYHKLINLVFKSGKKSFWEKSLSSLFFLLKKN